MGTRYIFIENLTGAEIGMHGAGLLHQKGDVVDNLLPDVEKLLLLKKKIVPESDLQQQQAKQAEQAKSRFPFKRGRGAPENKAR